MLTAKRYRGGGGQASVPPVFIQSFKLISSPSLIRRCRGHAHVGPHQISYTLIAHYRTVHMHLWLHEHLWEQGLHHGALIYGCSPSPSEHHDSFGILKLAPIKIPDYAVFWVFTKFSSLKYRLTAPPPQGTLVITDKGGLHILTNI